MNDPRAVIAARITRMSFHEDDLIVLSRMLDAWEDRNKRERAKEKKG